MCVSSQTGSAVAINEFMVKAIIEMSWSKQKYYLQDQTYIKC